MGSDGNEPTDDVDISEWETAMSDVIENEFTDTELIGNPTDEHAIEAKRSDLGSPWTLPDEEGGEKSSSDDDESPAKFVIAAAKKADETVISETEKELAALNTKRDVERNKAYSGSIAAALQRYEKNMKKPQKEVTNVSDSSAIESGTTVAVCQSGSMTQTEGQSGVISAFTGSSETTVETGTIGRYWEMGTEETERKKNQPSTPEASKFAQSLMSKTRSRAEPDAVMAPSSNVDADQDSRRNMIRISGQDEQLIMNTSLAKKRVRVVQLLAVGLVALLVALLGSFWVQSSCHFVSTTVEVGQNAQTFELHYGLWQYTPYDSAFRGYSYCSRYDDFFTSDSPLISRLAGCLSMVAGGIALFILWSYLIFGRGSQKVWNLAVICSALAGALQLSTLTFLTGTLCQGDYCTLGPAGFLSVVAGMVYFVLAFEMHYNSPWNTEVDPSQETTVEMAEGKGNSGDYEPPALIV